MLYLKSIAMDRFKSFKHAELLFSNGFTCVVGPNGSGKSNICDSLLFGLGENSLRRLRANRLESLINSSTKGGENGLRKAYVRIRFGGDEDVTVVRAVRSDGKSMYKLNGKHMSKQEVLELLGKHGIRADETNTITQGEINAFVDLSTKERRILIDIASGIKEFEYKKDEAMKELEKVSQRISEARIMLNERSTYLKDLESEKEAAEKYNSMSSRLKVLNYSILNTRKEEADKSYSEYTKEMAIIDSKKNELTYNIEGLAKGIEQSSAERQQITKELGEGSQQIGATNAKLEAVNLELTKIDVELNNVASTNLESEKTIKELESETASATEKIKSNGEEIEQENKKINDMEKRLGSYKINAEDSDAYTAKINDLNSKINEIQESVVDAQNYISGLQAEHNSLKANLESRLNEAKELEKEISVKRKDKDKALEEISALNNKSEALGKKIKKNEGEKADLAKELDTISSAIINLKEQRASLRSRGNIASEEVAQRFKEEDGYYGRVSGLCTYKSEYSYAIEVAAGGRFEYLVVDSIETANRIINYLKENSLGRATFIPLKELEVAQGTKKEQSASAIIDIIKFDEKFENVFNYLFNNTYLIDEVSSAKKLGLGKHRYVTVSGELVEQSGIISGGSQGKRLSVSQIENRLKAAEEQKSKAAKELELIENQLFADRKSDAQMEMETKSIEKELGTHDALIISKGRIREDLLKSTKELESKIGKIGSEITDKDREKMEMASKLGESKETLGRLYNDAIEASMSIAKHGMGRKEQEEMNTLRSDLEQIKIKRAELQKEDEILGQRIKETEAQTKEKRKAMKALNEGIRDKEIRKQILHKSKKQIGAEIINSSDSNKRLYEKLNKADSEIAKLNELKIKASADYLNIERQLTELKMKRAQVETRLSDLAAEIAAYNENIAPVKLNLEEMDKEATVLKVKLSELGNVNLKAPDLYEEKRRDVEEAGSKVETLESERKAILRMMEEIDSKKLQTFMSTLNDVSKNFSQLYSYVFPGKAALSLEKPVEPFNSGLEIKVSDGKTTKMLSGLSGGQKSFISLILIFAIHMCKPSSLYIFDEVDAALDKDNSKKLSQLIKEMSKNAQFIVVSHNDSLIVNADTAIGVVMSNGESKAVGIEIASVIKEKKQ